MSPKLASPLTKQSPAVSWSCFSCFPCWLTFLAETLLGGLFGRVVEGTLRMGKEVNNVWDGDSLVNKATNGYIFIFESRHRRVH